MGFDYEFKIRWKNKGFRQVLRLLPPRSVDQGIDYFNNIVETNLASRLGDGIVTAYQRATTLHMMPVTLIGVAISTAAFPKMSERMAVGRTDLFRKELQTIIRVIIWLALPTAVIVFFARGYIVSFVRVGGDPLIANILGVLAVAILFRSIYHIAARSFYAQQDTKTPLYISLVTISLNIFLAVVLVLHFKQGVFGLALAQSVVAIIEVAILFTIMSRRIKQLFNVTFFHSVSRMVSASGLMGIICYLSVQVFPFAATDQTFLATFPKFVAIVVISLTSYVFISKLFKLEEVNPILERVSNVLFKQFRPPKAP
jgi:putative peptidoglycan lipid II flippase